MEFEIQGKEGVTRIRVGEGATLELRLIVNNVYRKGNDPATGVPLYIVQSQTTMRLVNFDKKLRKPVLKQPGPGEGSPGTGVG